MFSVDPNTNDIILTRGDTLSFHVAIMVDGEEYTPESGDVIRFAMKENENDTEPYLRQELDHATMNVVLDPEDTKELDYGTYRYDIEISFANDGPVYTFISAKIRLTWEAD